ncbi:MAG: polysaccharide biosynthesis C-terminal domain-containing protein [Lachnospiraceae bacterium]|nr:polysaccharide biosynthesis C-terminal domain-containing protein [Lachnospiraceae bacterium]
MAKLRCGYIILPEIKSWKSGKRMRLKNSLYNTFFLLIQQLVTAVYGLVIPSLIIKTYGSSVNGVVSSITQFLSYITLLEAGVGGVITAAMYKPLAERNENKLSGIVIATEQFFRKLAKIFIIYLVILAIIYPYFVKDKFDWLFTFTLVLIISISTFVQYYFGITYQMLLGADQKSWIVACIQIISTIISFGVTLLCVYKNTSIHTLKVITTLVYVFRPVAFNYFVKRHYKINRYVEPDNEALKHRWDGLAHHIAYIIHCNTDMTVLTIFSNVLEVSVYSVYYNIVVNIGKVVSSFSSGIKASIGNLIACGKMDSVKQILDEFETLYFMIITIFYTCIIILVVPFVSIYTRGVADVNYCRPTFSILLACAEAAYALRNPYDMVIFASGHFKQTKKGAYEEAFINIAISVILVKRYGIIGVAIGTLVAMLFRVFQYVLYLKNNILFRSPSIFLKKLCLNVLIGFIVVVSSQYISIETKNYFQWAQYAFFVLIYTTSTVFLINIIFYKKEVFGIVRHFRKNKNK